MGKQRRRSVGERGIAAVVSAEDPYVGSTHTPHTLGRFHYLKQSGYSNEAAVRFAAPELSDVQPSFLYDEQQLCNKLFPSGENTEVQSYGEVEKEVKKSTASHSKVSSHNCVGPHIFIVLRLFAFATILHKPSGMMN